MEVQLQVGVKVLLRDVEGRYLLLHRSREKYPEVQNLWDIPGGRINPGIGLRENLEREVLEETGLTLHSLRRLLTAQDIIRLPARHVVRITYEGDAEGEVTLDNQEHDDFRWCRVEEMRQLDGLDPLILEALDCL